MDLQSHSVEELRTRAASLVTVAGVAVAFFVGLALRGEHARMHAFTWVAVGAFTGVVASVVFVLWSRNFWFTNDPKIIVDQWIDERDIDINDTYRHLAQYYSANFETNEAALAWMHRVFSAGAFLLGLAVVAAIIDVAGRR